MPVGQQIKILRKHLNLSQEDFAFAISIKQGSLSQIESGTTNISQRTLKIICSEYSVNPKWLTKGEGEMFLKEEKQNNFEENIAPIASETDFWKQLAMSQQLTIAKLADAISNNKEILSLLQEERSAKVQLKT